MNILGYSGLNGSIKFRKEHYVGLTEQEYRMCQGLDSAACITIDGKIIAAAEEERFNGEKYTCDFPINAIEFCLKEAGLSIHEIDHVCHGFDYAPHHNIFTLNDNSKLYYDYVLNPGIQIGLWKTYFPEYPIQQKFISINHHLAHAATAYYPSGFDSALILVADGIGEIHSLSLFLAKDSEIHLLKNYNLLSSLGVLYSQVTAHLGFWVNSDEYKVMGLAPYGDSDRYRALFDKIIEYREQGTIFIDKFKLNVTDIDRQTGRAFRQWLTMNCFPQRNPDEPITQEHKDLAASLQKALEQSLLHILSYWKKKLNVKNLCMAGGVALNCSANGTIFRKDIFTDMYIQPAASDAGTAIGAAIVQGYRKGQNLSGMSRFELPFLGSDFGEEASKQAIKKHSNKISFKLLSPEALIQEAAVWITNRKVIAWMQDRMEFGPRALGNRSILADPTDPSMRDRINALVKKREAFRPFAPSVKLEAAHEYFNIPYMHEFPHMLYTVPVKKQYQTSLPAITHVDGSARIQTVNKKYAEKYWYLLDAIEKKSGIPIILNTSFNIKGQAIVRTPEEAINTLIATNIDALFMGNYLITVR